ncbi:hypothetical protein OIO90_006171 [Microbotryomycetes sp. JL221]|nr:hypothetical protein OIO90_006171 [Microbotryomycetes sp. JL221]
MSSLPPPTPTSTRPSSPSTSSATSSSSSSDASTASFTDALKTINPWQDIQKLPQVPCARFSLLFGIVAGTSVGTLRFLFMHSGSWSRQVGRLKAATTSNVDTRWSNVGSAANWAVGTWGVASLGAWETCRRRQTAEAARMQALVSEVKARRAAKATNPVMRSSSTSLSNNESESNAARGDAAGTRGIRGVLVGEHGKEMLQDRQRDARNAQSGDPVDRSASNQSSKWNW